MPIRGIAICVAAGVLLASVDVLAQPLDGCTVGLTQIPSITNPGLPDGAMAGFTAGGMPAIFVNPAAAAVESSVMKRWVYWHECAHHVLGHAAAGAVGLSRPYVDEQQADCWSIQHLVRDEGLSNDDVSGLQAEASRLLSQTGDRSHLPAIARALNLRVCLAAIGSGRPPTPGPACRSVTVYHTEWRTETSMETRIVPCQHRACLYCPPAHYIGDQVLMPVSRQVPVQVPTTVQDCSGSPPEESTPNEPRASRWRYEYQRMNSDRWIKSMTFSSEEACTASRDRKDASPDYVVLNCEEVD